VAKLNISLAQMNIALGDVRKNVAIMQKMVEEASRRGSKMIVLPELWSTGYDLQKAKDYASQLNQGLFAQLSTAATQYKIAITGSILELRGLAVSNSAPVFHPTGRMMGVYRKIHLFRLMQEDQYLQAGSSPLMLDLPWGPTGVAICYDLRFPELFRRYALDGAKMVIIPAEWPLARIEHWRALLIARAIENQCYLVACNSAGDTGGTVFGGHSMVVDPWGRIVIEAGEEPQLLTVEIEMNVVEEARSKIPVFEDRREDVYG
jgi:predicted amidohydrolase